MLCKIAFFSCLFISENDIILLAKKKEGKNGENKGNNKAKKI